METLSIIISAFDHHDLTVVHAREAMDSIITPHEVIIVNDGGTPDLKEKLKVLPNKCKLIYARINEDILWNYNGACNLGVWLSTGDYISLEDNDNIPMRNTYKEMLEIFKNEPEMGRVRGSKRLELDMEDIYKPVEEWVQRGSRGPNMGTCMMKRDVYLQVKGQDERFCGQYGWMYYDWKSRLLRITKFTGKGHFWYVRDGQSDLDRAMSKKNFRLYRENAHRDKVQHPEGILNFSYEYEILNDN